MKLRMRKHFISPPLQGVEVWHIEHDASEDDMNRLAGYTPDDPYVSDDPRALSFFIHSISRED
jgi:hypothetical protein